MSLFLVVLCVTGVAAGGVEFAKPHVQPAPRQVDWKLDTCVDLKDGTRVRLELDVELDEASRWFEQHCREAFRFSPHVHAATVTAGQELGQEAYRLRLGADGIVINAHGLTGVRYAFQSLRQMVMPKRGTLKIKGWIAPACDIRDSPASKFRGMHLCWFPETDVRTIERCIRLAGYYKMNVVVIENWGTFRSQKYPWWGWKDGKMTKAEIQRLRSIAEDLGVTLVPQFNVFGHASMSRGHSAKHAVLDVSPEYLPLYEPGGWNWCLSNPVVWKVVEDLVVEMHEAFGNPPYFHMGCDEAGEPRCAECRSADYLELVASHITRVANLIASRKARPLMWHDMLLKKGEFKPFYAHASHGEEKLLGRLPKSIIICDWFYDDKVQKAYPTFAHFREAGYDVLTCPWENKVAPTEAQAKAMREAGGMGLLGTTWHHVYRQMICSQFVPSAAAAWGTCADSYDFDDHWRQMGWDMKISAYPDCGTTDSQIPTDTNPEVVPKT